MTEDEVIAQLRKLVGKYKNQREAATALAISGPYLSDVLNGRRSPGPTILQALGLRKSYEKVKS